MKANKLLALTSSVLALGVAMAPAAHAGEKSVTTVTSSPSSSLASDERPRSSDELPGSSTTTTTTTSDTDIDRARDQERSLQQQKTDTEVAAARAEERAKMETELREKDKVIADALVTPVGLYGFVGGGATNFTQPGAVGATSIGGYWDVRLGVGSRSILGGELAYVGGSRDISALGLNNSAFLTNNGVEGVARLNVPITSKNVPFLIEPYTFGGIGWQHYSLVDASSNTSSVKSDDDIMTIPMGIGMSFGFSAVTLDIRGTYRHAIGSNLLGSETSSFDDTSLNSWGAGAALGFEF